MPRHLYALAAVLLIYSQSAYAHNAAGHKTIAAIAWQKLDANQRQSIVKILRKHPRFDEDFKNEMPQQILSGSQFEQDRWIFCQAAIWPDIVRGISQPDQGKYHRPRWHYINLPVFLDADQAAAFSGNITANVEFSLPGGGNQEILNGVQAVKNSLNVVTSSTASDAQKAVHYCWLIHVIPDLAQPLHSAALFTTELFPGGDKGGNAIKIRKAGSSGGGKSLHSVWDGLLGTSNNFSAVLTKASELITNNQNDFNATFVALPNDVWSTESQVLAFQTAYGPILGEIQDAEESQVNLDVIEVEESYYKQAGALMEKRAIAAGVRLAGVLSSTVPTSGGPVPFALGSPGVEFPAVIAASRATRPFGRQVANGARAISGSVTKDELAQRVELLEAQIRHLTLLLEGGASVNDSRARRSLNAVRPRAVTPHDDGEQCDCGQDE